MTNTRQTRQDRVKLHLYAAWCGQLIGDAYGSTYEFSTPLPQPTTRPVDLVGGGPFHWNPGDVTDDSQMAAAIAHMYLRCGTYNQGVHVEQLLKWLESRPKDIGGWTRGILSAWRNATPLTRCTSNPLKKQGLARHPAVRAWVEGGSDNASNGGPMKCVPTLLATPKREDRIREARLICMDTHPDPRCWLSVVFMIEFAHELAEGKQVHRAYQKAMSIMMGEAAKHDVPYRYTRILTEALVRAPTLEWNKWNNGGYVIPTMEVAVAAVFQAKSFEEGLRMVISRGGDTDTVGAIAGVLLGARFGTGDEKGIPADLIPKIQDGYVDLGVKLLDLRQARM